MNVRDCDLYFLPGCDPNPKYTAIYQSTFQAWDKVWRATLSELQVEGAPGMDGFTRQDEILSICNSGQCIALLLFRWMDFALVPFYTDSYFKVWKPEHIEKLLIEGPCVMTATYLSVDQDFRKSKTGISFRDLMMDIMIHRFLSSSAHVLANIGRRERNVHLAGYNLGGTCIAEDIYFFNPQDRIDLVGIYKSKARFNQDQSIRSWSDHLWNKRILVDRHHSHRSISVPLKKAG